VYVGGWFTQVYNGSELISAQGVAMIRWNEANQTWIWSDLDGGVQSFPLNPVGAGVIRLALAQSRTNSAYDLYVGGDFVGVGSAQYPSWRIARWRVGYPSPANAPRVTITSPRSPTIFTNPATILLNGLATSSYTNIHTADFYTNGTVVGTRLNYPLADGEPFAFTNEWNSNAPNRSLAPGIYLVSATATDSGGLIGKSAPLVVSIKDTNNPVMAVDDQYTIPQGTLTGPDQRQSVDGVAYQPRYDHS
jgi:hypothetical protein